MKKRKQLILTLVAVVTLVALVAGATYAYFAVGTTDNFGTTNINATANNVGMVTLDGVNANLTISLSAVDMMASNANTYYASSEGKTTTPTEVTIGTASVSPSTDTNYYHCKYQLSVTHAGTKDMYDWFNHQTNDVYDYTNRSAGQIVLTINGVDYDFTGNWPNTIAGEFNTKVGSPAEITAGFRIVNAEDIDQTYLAGTDINIAINVVANSLICEAVEEPTQASKTIIKLANNTSCGIQKYTGKVTDRWQDYGEGVDATKVYYLINNNCNNVIFEDYCWKIIRTTETGGIKLLYNGTPVDNNGHQECVANNGVNAMLTATQMNTSSNIITYSQGGAKDKVAYVGYMYNPNSLNGTYYDQLRADNVNTTDSLFKEKIEYWFENNSGIDESKLEDAVFCNDRSLASDSPVTEEQLSTATSGDIYFKNADLQSTLECTLETDAFSTSNAKAQIKHKVGFMTEPERSLIGDTPANNGQYYWLGSPCYWSGSFARVRRVNSYGSVNFYNVDDAVGVRPVVSAGSGVQITSGEGSTTNPFIAE